MSQDSNYWLRGRVSRRKALGGAGMGLSALALAACGGGNNNAGKATNNAATTAANTGAKPGGTSTGLLPAATTATPAAATAKQPKPGGSFSFQISSPPPSLDPYTQTSYVC